MSENHTPAPLAPARSGARENNPNAGKRHAAPASRRDRPRLGDGKRHAVRVAFIDPATARRRIGRRESVLGDYTKDVRDLTRGRADGVLPRVKRKRREWTTDAILTLAQRAEDRGTHKRAAQLLALALEREGTS